MLHLKNLLEQRVGRMISTEQRLAAVYPHRSRPYSYLAHYQSKNGHSDRYYTFALRLDPTATDGGGGDGEMSVYAMKMFASRNAKEMVEKMVKPSFSSYVFLYP
jgi:hypothetical protein